jgi:hypothetical protein
MKFYILMILLLVHTVVHAQLRYTKLVLEPKQSFSFGQSDILVVDTLIMKDSSSIVLNKSKIENYLHARVIRLGKNCFIDGRGASGRPGKNGRAGESFAAPCKSGTNGGDATRGDDGKHATNLLIYLNEIKVDGQLTILLEGGNGGNGGQGGEGGSAGSGIIHCNGGNGGNGGPGGDGGFGGNGGKLTIHGPISFQQSVKGKIVTKLNGGQFGKGGRGGYSGYGGLGPKNKNGKNGLQGIDGKDGSLGNYGNLNYVEEAIVAAEKK